VVCRWAAASDRRQTIHVVYPDDPLARLDEALATEGVERHAGRLPGGADELTEVCLGETEIDANAFLLDAAVFPGQPGEGMGQPGPDVLRQEGRSKFFGPAATSGDHGADLQGHLGMLSQTGSVLLAIDGAQEGVVDHLRAVTVQGLAEYGLLVAGVALMGMAAVSVLGGRVSDMIGVVANLLPSASVENSAPVATGQIIETTSDDGVARLDGSANVHNADQGYSSLQQAVGMHRTADGQHGWGHTVQRNGQSAPTID